MALVNKNVSSAIKIIKIAKIGMMIAFEIFVSSFFAMSLNSKTSGMINKIEPTTPSWSIREIKKLCALTSAPGTHGAPSPRPKKKKSGFVPQQENVSFQSVHLPVVSLFKTSSKLP